MKPEPLEFARGIRFPRADEIPAANDAAVASVKTARITTGYVSKDVDEKSFSAVIEANVHASQIWSVFSDLAVTLLPPVAAPIIGVKDEEPVLGPYTMRDAALKLLEQYKEPLQHDGFLEFGLIFQSGGVTEEVFVRSVKYFQIWTNNPGRAVEVLERHRIAAVPDLHFIDEYPRVSETLPFRGRSSGWSVVMEEVQEGFADLPEPSLPPTTS